MAAVGRPPRQYERRSALSQPTRQEPAPFCSADPWYNFTTAARRDEPPFPMRPPAPPREGQILTGSLFNEPMRVETVAETGPGAWTLGLVGTRSERFRRVALGAAELAGLTVLDSGFRYDGDGALLRLGPAGARARHRLGVRPLVRAVGLARRSAAAPVGGGLRPPAEAAPRALPAGRRRRRRQDDHGRAVDPRAAVARPRRAHPHRRPVEPRVPVAARAPGEVRTRRSS